MMKKTDFNFDLPERLIAQKPCEERTGSRLLCLDKVTGDIVHKHFRDLSSLLRDGDLLVFNDSRVIKARFFGQKETGGKVEIFIERLLSPYKALAQLKSSKAPKEGTVIDIGKGRTFTVTGRDDDMFFLALDEQGTDWESVLDRVGQTPLPPYIKRDPKEGDEARYQTVYAKDPGSVAAPTAGLHFDERLIECLSGKGVDMGYVTLHVGAGTFQPVRSDDILNHKMHSERIEIDEALCEEVNAAKARGGRVIAVGTTSVRCLETAWDKESGMIKPYKGETDIFIYPGYKFQAVDALITNFHLPESTLLMLVSALAGQENILNAYSTAVAQEYRFFSYGDAMFIKA